MKKLREMTVAELQAYRREQSDNISAIDAKADAEKREMTTEETAQRAAHIREFDNASREIQARNQDAQAAQLQQRETKDERNAHLRELLMEARTGKQAREITLDYKNSGANSAIVDSGAVNLNIHDIIPSLEEGLGLPPGISIVTGVTGNQLWPVSIDDVEIEEVAETAALTGQNLNFSKVQAVPGRVGLTVNVSNTAIDNTLFNLIGFIQEKFTRAMRRFLAKKIYSQAAFTGIAGPFKALASSGTITLDNTAYASVLAAVAAFADKGINSDKICIVMDATTEANLKSTPKANGQGGFIIENGKCAGYDYVVSPWINTTLGTGDNANKIVATTDKFIGIGCFDFLPVQFHGVDRLSIDATSRDVAVRNITAITFNTEVSITEIQPYANGTAVKAFSLYKIVTGTGVTNVNVVNASEIGV